MSANVRGRRCGTVGVGDGGGLRERCGGLGKDGAALYMVKAVPGISNLASVHIVMVPFGMSSLAFALTAPAFCHLPMPSSEWNATRPEEKVLHARL
ncbi:uncharacterized protein ARMOST_21727 [Armillaria ostoyae]|uniref:Uncharacterized protein n=1 Tax=Armillaria ostoyae TaxID=47428 RepID=A0A284SAU7_ARMOS|nr:uncharacterized protein ARMOST_21727 [Armillaria ostoyae]